MTHPTPKHLLTTPRPASTGYDRVRDLPRLLLIWPDQLADRSAAGSAKIVDQIKSMLRRERQRGRAGDWTYDLARHRHLLIAYRAESAALRRWTTARMASVHPRPIYRAASPSPFSWPIASEPRRNWVQPSDNREAGPISRDILPETNYSASANAVSAI